MCLTRNYHQRNTSWNAPYTFSGKEKDAETGYGYFGARYYDSGLSIWLSVDPMSDKYPSMSPYNYCANNPVILVDPDGREFMIGGFLYKKGEACPTDMDDKGYKAIWNTMNIIYDTPMGKIVINAMDVKGYIFEISKDTKKEDSGGTYTSNGKNNGGKIHLNGNISNVLTLAHEVFHGYQDLNKQGGRRSIPKEVEANLFALLVYEKAFGSLPTDNVLDQRVRKDNKYDEGRRNLVHGRTFSSANFNNYFGFIVSGFKNESVANEKNKYIDYDDERNGNRNLVKQFYNITE